MTKPKLTYFDMPASRGEECRLALHLSGVEFEDVRVKRPDWPAVKAQTPFGSVPTFELPGHPVLAQSNAILVYIGRRWGLHPKDDFEAARHEMMMDHVEDLRHAIAATLRMTDDDKRRAREAIAETTLPTWAGNSEKQLGDGPFFAGDTLNIVDIKLFVMIRWLVSGVLDHIPPTIVSAFPKLMRVHDAVAGHAGVRAWYSR
jgi:prostaglandin-H2 D-isomerase / glutathione transferase